METGARLRWIDGGAVAPAATGLGPGADIAGFSLVALRSSAFQPIDHAGFGRSQ